MANEKTSKAPDRKIVYVKPLEGTKSVYTNHFQVGQTVYDFKVIFGEMTDVNDETVEITQHVQVTMSWLEAKALAATLAIYIENFEEASGPIRTEFPAIRNPPLPPIPNVGNQK